MTDAGRRPPALCSPRAVGYPRPVDLRLLTTLTRAVRAVTAAVLLVVVVGQVCAHLGAALSQRGLALTSGCLSDRLGLGWWGTHLAMVRTSAECPEGTFALGAEPGVAAAVVVSVAIPALLAHLAAAVIGAGTLGAVRGALLSVGRLLARVTLRLPRPATLPDAAARHAVLRAVLDQVGHPLRLALVPVRRGPPVGAPA